MNPHLNPSNPMAHRLDADKMSPQELMELASLDAMGLLDPEDREAFDAGFAAAPPALQAQIRREQTRVALFQAVLPQVDPPLGLRAKVLASLREAMRETVQTVSSRSGATDVIASIRPSRGVNRLWRVGAIAAAAASIALSFSMIQIRSDYDAIASTMDSITLTDELRERYGANFDRLLFAESSSLVQLRATQFADQRSRPTGMVLVDASNDAKSIRGMLLVQGLVSGEHYELVLRDQDGRTLKALTHFTASPANRENRMFESVSLENAASIALVRVSDNMAVLVGQI